MKELGVSDLILKPFDYDEFVGKVNDCFRIQKNGTYTTTHKQTMTEGKVLSPRTDASLPFVKFWGIRGSIPVAGSKYIHYGGNTSCISMS